MDMTGQTYLNVSIALVILPIIAIILVLRGIKGEGERHGSLSLFYAYLIFGCCGAITFWAQNILALKITLAPFSVFYILCSWILVLAVTGWRIKKRQFIFVAIVHVVSIVLMPLLPENQRVITFSVYSLIAYSIITVFEYRRAMAMRNIGNGIISVVGLAVLLVSFFKLYAIIVLADINLAHHAHLIITGSGFVLVGIGILASILVQEHRELDQQKKMVEKEQEISEKLLLNILPADIAERLKNNESTIADHFEDVTVLFADLVGFTLLSKKIPPEELVTLLNSLFSRFDALAEKHGLEKVKTNGDSYMIAGGLPELKEGHVESVANIALAMRQELAQFNLDKNQTLDIRIGIHTGCVVAGVIGVKKMVYDVWGDTVNTASRMESHGIPGQIQVSEQTYERLKGKYEFKERGFIDVKGQGKMKTYFLQGDNKNIY
jgi:class 3 adenylate cyclase